MVENEIRNKEYKDVYFAIIIDLSSNEAIGFVFVFIIKGSWGHDSASRKRVISR